MKSIAFLFIPIALSMLAPVSLQAFGGDPLQIQVDYARFRGPDNGALFIEVYYSIPQHTMAYQVDSTGLHAEVVFTMFVRKGDSTAHASRWLVPHTVTDTSAMNSNTNLIGITSFTLPPGDYTMTVIARDRYNETRVDSAVMTLPITRIPIDRMAISDIELASKIQRGDKSSPFYKNTLDVVPNVQLVYGEEQTAYAYAEAYNLDKSGVDSLYHMKTGVFDALGHDVISRDRTRKRIGESSVILDNISVGNLRTGTYTLIMALVDTAGKIVSSSGKKFYVYNKNLGIDSTMLAASSTMTDAQYRDMSVADLDQEFAYARYVASPAEREQFEKLDGKEAKAKFLTEFWSRRGLSIREEYLRRIAHSNSTFRAMGREGFKTDRGRVYTVYGPPDDVERHPNDSDSRPYEIWSYNSIQGGVIFVFVQRSSGGDYELVHSTHRNELHDENWQRYTDVR
jgi:GWxTD domain-containing protein